MARALRTPFLILAVLLAACLDDSPFVPKIEETNFDPSLGVDLAASTKTSSGLYYRDIIVGTGDPPVPMTGSAAVTTTYSLYLRTGELMDQGPYDLVVGSGENVIPGYEEGLRGMRAGGRRQLIVPPHLGYGDRANGSIPANSILVFTVDVTNVVAAASLTNSDAD